MGESVLEVVVAVECYSWEACCLPRLADIILLISAFAFQQQQNFHQSFPGLMLCLVPGQGRHQLRPAKCNIYITRLVPPSAFYIWLSDHWTISHGVFLSLFVICNCFRRILHNCSQAKWWKYPRTIKLSEHDQPRTEWELLPWFGVSDSSGDQQQSWLEVLGPATASSDWGDSVGLRGAKWSLPRLGDRGRESCGVEC